jgi:hypothetical protein
VRAVVLIALLIPVIASAHERTHPKQIDVHLDPQGITLRVHFNVMAGQKAREARSDFDANRDGQLGATEAEALVRRLTTFATHALRISVEGKELPSLSQEVIARRGLNAPPGAGSDLGITLKMRYPFPFPGEPTRLQLRDWHPDPKWDVAVRLHAKDLTIQPTRAAVMNREKPLELLVTPVR